MVLDASRYNLDQVISAGDGGLFFICAECEVACSRKRWDACSRGMFGGNSLRPGERRETDSDGEVAREFGP